MAHFAHMTDDSVVDWVIVVSDNDCGGGDFPESEPIGQNFINNELKLDGLWLQTSYHANFRGRYAGIGMRYDEELDEFVEQELPSP